MGQKTDLDSMCPAAGNAALGTKVATLTTLANELKGDFNALRAEVLDLHTKYGALLADVTDLHAKLAAHIAVVAHPDAVNVPTAMTATAAAAITSTNITAASVAALT